MKAVMRGIEADLLESFHLCSQTVQDPTSENNCQEAITSYAQQSRGEVQIEADLLESLHLGSKTVQDSTSENNFQEAITSYAQQSHGEVRIDVNLESLHLGTKTIQDSTNGNNCQEAITSYVQQFHGEVMHKDSLTDRQLDKGYLEFGCTHYRRRCRVRAPCCNEIFDCRHCHDESKTSKKQFHCLSCGTVECCISLCSKVSHSCIEGLVHCDCPICFEHLFETTSSLPILLCGHAIHKACLSEMMNFRKTCPVCSKSLVDMSQTWEKYDMEIAATPMPPSLQNKLIRILCNDCNFNSLVRYHFLACKCPNCKSYNTRRT